MYNRHNDAYCEENEGRHVGRWAASRYWDYPSSIYPTKFWERFVLAYKLRDESCHIFVGGNNLVALFFLTLGYQDILTFVHNEFDVDKYEVQSALIYYKKAGCKELIDLYEAISKVFVMFGGNLDAESEDDKDDDEDDEVNNSSLYTCLQSDLMIAFFLKSDIEE